MAAQTANSAARLSIESGCRQQRWLCAVRVLHDRSQQPCRHFHRALLLSCSPESSRRLKEDVLPRAFRRHSGVSVNESDFVEVLVDVGNVAFETVLQLSARFKLGKGFLLIFCQIFGIAIGLQGLERVHGDDFLQIGN
jgi:hypothetical protein